MEKAMAAHFDTVDYRGKLNNLTIAELAQMYEEQSRKINDIDTDSDQWLLEASKLTIIGNLKDIKEIRREINTQAQAASPQSTEAVNYETAKSTVTETYVVDSVQADQGRNVSEDKWDKRLDERKSEWANEQTSQEIQEQMGYFNEHGTGLILPDDKGIGHNVGKEESGIIGEGREPIDWENNTFIPPEDFYPESDTEDGNKPFEHHFSPQTHQDHAPACKTHFCEASSAQSPKPNNTNDNFLDSEQTFDETVEQWNQEFQDFQNNSFDAFKP